MSLKDQILSAEDLTTEDLQVPEWGVTVYVRTLTGKERDEFEASLYVARSGDQQANFENLRARMVAKCMVDENGERVFGDKPDDIKKLGGKSSKALDRVYEVAQRLNGLREEDVEELTKNSETTPGDDSSSASQKS